MSSKTKIVVLRMKEIIYTAIFLGLALLLVILFLFMFRPKSDTTETPGKVGSSDAQTVSYIPGVYASSMVLGNQNVNVEVTVDSEQITSVSLVPLSESVATMYPLMQPAMDVLAAQILENQSLEGLEYPSGSQYTAAALVRTIEQAISKATITE